jgi:hypothetical protein
MRCRQNIHKTPASLAFEESNSPAISVLISATTALAKSFKRKADIGRYVAIHSK